jgi:hypothetical protein
MRRTIPALLIPLELITLIILGGNVRRKKTSKKTLRMWEDNIKMDLRKRVWDGMD